MKSRQEIEYAQRFLKDDLDQNVYKSKDFNMNRMSVSQLFGKKKVPQAQPVEELKDDEVTDIIDDNEIMAQPLMKTLSKGDVNKLTARSKWSEEAKETPP